MTDEPEVWQRYDRDKLPQGWAYPLGRDQVAEALVAARATVGSLSFNAGTLRPDDLYVLRVYWPSDANARYFHSTDFEPNPLTFSLQAVPSSLRLPMGKALRDTWLEQAMEWVCQAPQRGNAWTASDHHWNLIYRPDTGFIVDAG